MTARIHPVATEPDVIAYTDGGCRGNPGPGGWGFLLINTVSGNALERCGGERETTNNRMEMLAAIEAIKAIKKPGMRLLVHSDSQYLIKCASEWIPGWKARGWKKKKQVWDRPPCPSSRFFMQRPPRRAPQQQVFRTPDFGRFRQHGRAAVRDHQIDSCAQGRIGGDAGPAIRTATLQTDSQARCGNRLALHLRRFRD